MNEANKMRLFFVAMLFFYILLHVFAYSPEWISSCTRWISSSHTFVYKDVESSLPGYGDRLWIITKKKKRTLSAKSTKKPKKTKNNSPIS